MKVLCYALALGASAARALSVRRAVTMSTAGTIMPKVVVTGLGAVTAVGTGHEDLWTRVCNGETGIKKVTCFDDVERFTHGAAASHVGAAIEGFDAKAWFMSPKTANSHDRYTHLSMAASRLAFEDAGLVAGAFDEDRVGVMIGTAFGGIATIEAEMERMQTRGPRKVSPFAIPAMLANSASGVVAIELGCKGPNFGVVSACAAGTHAIGEAFRALRCGKADVVICGGSEAAMTPLMYGGFGAMKAMCAKYNDDPAKASRPFDKDRAGFVMGEGAGVIVLETAEHAAKRGAKQVYCELAGYGATCDAHHITTPAPEGAGLAKCLERALREAAAEPTDVQYINAHGTSTAYNDKFETAAIKTVFGDHAKSANFFVSSTKGATGHTLGAAGGIEAVLAIKAIQKTRLPPTINYVTPDEDCDLNYVPNTPVDCDVQVAISQNLGFGGHNGALVFKK